MPSTGPNNPGTDGSAALSGSSHTWFGTVNITGASDANGSYSVIGNGAWTNYLTATNFGFSIPSGATIDGIVVEWRKKVDTPIVVDQSVKIVKGGSIIGNEKGDGVTQWSGTYGYISYGGSSDLWGTTWSESDIEASGFGCGIAALGGAPTGGIPYVEHCRITVYYTEAVPPTARIAWIKI